MGVLFDLFTIIEDNFFEMDADRTRFMPVVRTIVGGKEIWSAIER